MLALQSRTLQYSTMAYYRGIAAQIGNGLAASIRANADGVSSYSHTYVPNDPLAEASCLDKTCTAAQMADADIAWARTNARAQLPAGDLNVTHGSDKDGNYVDVVLIWIDPKTQNAIDDVCGSLRGKVIPSADTQTQCLAVRVRL